MPERSQVKLALSKAHDNPNCPSAAAQWPTNKTVVVLNIS